MADMIGKNIAAAANAYAKAARGFDRPPLEGREANDGPGGEFADLVKGAIDEAVKIGERSEQLSMAAINDKADLNKVVTAVAEAEVTLRTVVAVRDKVLEAYREIIKMPM